MLGVSDIESTSLSRLLTSTIVAVVVVLFLSHSFSTYLIKPMTYDGTLVRSGRYSFVFEAWDTIGEENEDVAVVAIGSSLTQYGFNGSCIEVNSDHGDSRAYNLGIPGSYPYLDMTHTERGVNSNPEIIILELNPISLSKVSAISEENIRLRLTLASLFLKISDYGGWNDILHSEDQDFIDGIILNRYNSESEYFADSVEELIIRFKQNRGEDEWWHKDGHWYLGVPQPNSDEWESYLSQPSLLSRYLSKLTPEELEEYENITIPNLMKRERYKPTITNNTNLQSLDYTVSRYSEEGIPIILITYPIHPLAVDSLSPGQLDEYNLSVEKMLTYQEVSHLDLLWGNQLQPQDFYDYEHLDFTGREKLCPIVSEEVNRVLNLSKAN